jgi:hypothetical protein
MYHPHSSALHALFEGFTQAYGVYLVKQSDIDRSTGGKVKGQAASLVGEVTQKLWSDHLTGKQGLGIIPINEHNLCRFGAIDVDDYSLDPSSLQNKVKQLGLPLVVCRTKSGGAHLYCFSTDFVSAALMQSRLSLFASALGLGNCEIFPKQTELLVERGDAGSWINMPYFGGNNTERYGLSEQGNPIKDIDAFIKFVSEKMVDPAALAEYQVIIREPLGPDAPPCLNALCGQGFPEGTRNTGLMQLGVFAIMKNKDQWERDLDELNSKFMDPPLSSQEVLGVVKSLKKKDYRYLCKQQPMMAFCNRNKCRTVRYGIGPSTGMPAMGTLTKFDTSPPLWFVDVDGGGRLELETEDLQQPLRFQKKCMDQLNIMPPILTRENWSEIVSNMLESVNIVRVPHDATPEGMLADYISDFLSNKSNGNEGKDRDIVLLGQVWIDQGRFYFRIKDLMDFLVTKRFTEFRQNKVTSYLKTTGAVHQFFNIKGKGVNLYSLPLEDRLQNLPFNVPTNSGESPI